MNEIKIDEKSDVLLNVLTKQDLIELKPHERLSYYLETCKSLGLNPMTKPFEFISFYNSTLKREVLLLYATKNCCDQLRDLHKVSIKVVREEFLFDNRYYKVTVQATKIDGRFDEDISVIPLFGQDGKLFSGSYLANILMKGLTKARRRVTLAITGLSYMDETEVEALPDNKIKNINLNSGEIESKDKDKIAEIRGLYRELSTDFIIAYEWILERYSKPIILKEKKLELRTEEELDYMYNTITHVEQSFKDMLIFRIDFIETQLIPEYWDAFVGKSLEHFDIDVKKISSHEIRKLISFYPQIVGVEMEIRERNK